MNEETKNTLRELGICPDCRTPWEHFIEEPFASCKCGTSEWYKLDTPFMQMQERYYDRIIKTEKQAEYWEKKAIEEQRRADKEYARGYRDGIRYELNRSVKRVTKILKNLKDRVIV